MRPARFQDFILDLAKNAPGVTRVQTMEEAGEKSYPYGLVITMAGSEVRWQIIGQLADGEKHENNDVPVRDQPAQTWHEGDTPEAWLAGLIGRAESPEIASIDQWSMRPGANSAEGITIGFHNGARAFVRKA